MAHLQTQETRHTYPAQSDKPEERLEFKWKLIRSLYERGYRKEDIRQLFHFIDWMMKLPEELGQQLDVRIAEYEEEQKMPYITGIERRGIEQGMLLKAREYVLKGLQNRFKDVPLPSKLVEMVKSITSESVLDMLYDQTMAVESVPAFEQKVTEVMGKNGQLPASS